MDESLRQAVLGATNIQAPPSPLGASQGAELANMALAGFQLPQAEGASGALAQQSQDIVQAQNASAKAGGKGKYQKIPKSDGGFSFVDPDGNEISAAEYAAATGTTAADVLKDSQNPIDRAYLLDAKQLNNYINDKLNAKNDSQARSRAQAVETQVRKLYKIPLHQQTPDSLINAFVSAYPTVYGHTQRGAQGTNTLLPSADTIKAQNKKKKYNLNNSGL